MVIICVNVPTVECVILVRCDILAVRPCDLTVASLGSDSLVGCGGVVGGVVKPFVRFSVITDHFQYMCPILAVLRPVLATLCPIMLNVMPPIASSGFSVHQIK